MAGVHECSDDDDVCNYPAALITLVGHPGNQLTVQDGADTLITRLPIQTGVNLRDIWVV